MAESVRTPLGNDGPAAGDRLDSWKEIAAYLKREVRTVQRWEKTEGLPVHRHQHERLSTVYAFKSEIDVWWKERRILFETEEEEIFPDDDATGAAEGTGAEVAGEQATKEGDAASERRRAWRTTRWRVPLALVVVIVAGMVVYKVWPSKPQPPEVTVLAMLPFENKGDAAQQPFVDGLAHEIKNRLEVMQPEQLTVLVLPRRYAPAPDGEIVQRFHPDYLLHGRAELSGGVVTMEVRFVEARTGKTAWTQTYSGPLQGIAQLQQDIADRVVLVGVPVGEKSASGRLGARAPLVDPVAYESYLRGRYFWNKRSPDSLRKALMYFQTAVSSDPKYAPAYAGLADCYALLGSVPYNVEPPTSVFPQAEAAARKALALDSTLAEAHISLGYAQLVYERDYDEAGREFELALRLRPGEASAHDYYAYYLTAVGRLPEAIAERETARRLDPTSPLFVTALGEAYYHTRQFDLTIEETRKSLDLDPTYLVALINEGRALEQKGRHAEARSAYKTVLSYVPDDPGALALLGHEYGASGEPAEAEKIRGKLEQASLHRYVPAIYFAVVWLGLGDRDQAFHWMDKALDEHCDYLVYLATDPMADLLRGDPRFGVLLKKLGLQPPN
jgi:tetratricopeptide (TPR) repeat protein/TolB-like protein